MLAFWKNLTIPEPGVKGSFISMSNIISLFFDIKLLMNFVRSFIIFSRMSVGSCPSSSSMSHCCVVVMDMPIPGDCLHGLYAFIMVTR